MKPAVVAMAGVLGLLAAEAEAGCSDVALVLAIDASSSISSSEFDLQIEGYVNALTSAPVGQSFSDAGVVDLAAVFWADSAYKPQIVSWHRVTSDSDLTRFAEALAGTPRKIGGNTDLGAGLNVAIDLLTADAICADRLVIDVSGDGRASVAARRDAAMSVGLMRRRAEAEGIVINALAIRSDDPDLGDYYRRTLSTGIGAFVMEVDGFDTFQKAIAEKLMKEVLSGTVAICGNAALVRDCG